MPLIFLVIIFSIFSNPFLFRDKLPIPADTIIGLYNPFRDLYAKDYPNGIPFKNFLITDPVRQQYPWRNLVIDIEKKLQIPLWNPYSFAGYPLLANFQSASFYPFNFLLLILPFSIGWSVFILLQPILAGFFLYLYLESLKLRKSASLLGAITFSFCGFTTAWLEWGTIIHTGLWLPLILLSVDKINLYFNNFKNSYKEIRNNKFMLWSLVFVLSLVSAFFAGHLQTFFYLFLTVYVYIFVCWFKSGQSKKPAIVFIILTFIFLILTLVQWLPTVKFIDLSARSIDQDWQKIGWFIPWQNVIQFVVPDFFGNPTTLNYWGIWNYAEFVGYVGILPLFTASIAIFYRRDKKTLFFGTIFFLSLLFSFQTFFAKIPYLLKIPFISSAQPSRLLFLTDFSLAVLGAFGTDQLIRNYKLKQVIYSLVITTIMFGGLWIFVLVGKDLIPSLSLENLNVAKHNLYFPTAIFVIIAMLLISYGVFKNIKLRTVIITSLLIITCIDLLRFSDKFTPFTKKVYLFPQTKALTFLQSQKGQFRIIANDSRILPPNFSVMYHLQTLEGYDPLYLLRYGELIAALERNKPEVSPPFGFNRIITPHNIDSRLIDLLGVKFVLSLSDIKSAKFQKVFEEGQTKVYENNQVYDRAFFIKNIIPAVNKNEAITALFDNKIDLKDSAIAENWDITKITFASGSASIVEYKENKVEVLVKNEEEAFLVLMDTFYPTWNAFVCVGSGKNCQELKIYLTNYNFRGVIVPKGEHKVIFKNSLL
ncbi:MAG TPA: hypothetical protein VM077_01825 [Candidatus Limnocylindrales bacterium]|nr:hypothetical protein [Candidatus Limnocylindrales bacterium]